MLQNRSNTYANVLRRLLSVARGRPLAGVVLALLLTLNILSEMPKGLNAQGDYWSAVAEFVSAPFRAARLALFDGYQKINPRVPKTQPVTIVAIDEKSLAHVGQWPWPRNRVAALVDAINANGPAAIGLDIYMPEPDQTSPFMVAQGLAVSQKDLADKLAALPSNDAILARSLRHSPSVLGAAGFDFKAYTSKVGMRSVALRTKGENPLPHVRQFDNVLVSLPELQAAAHGQALLNLNTVEDTVRRTPLLSAVGEQLVPAMALEVLRVATHSSAVEVTTDKHGITQVGVADLQIHTQQQGDVWLPFARLQSGMSRYVSAIDVLEGRVYPDMFAGKLTLIGLTGSGLNDMRITALGEVVPGVEIHAQLIEALFDGNVLLRPWWMKWVETLMVIAIGLSLIWFVPRTDSRLAALLKNRPQKSLCLTMGVNLLLLIAGFFIFKAFGILVDVSALVLMLSMLMLSMIGSALIEGIDEAQTKLARLVDNGIMLGREHSRERLLQRTIEGAHEMVQCQEAILYLKTENNTLELTAAIGSTREHDRELLLHDAQRSLCKESIEAYAVNQANTVIVDDVRTDQRFFQAESNADAVSILCVPMQPRESEVIGLIKLVNAVEYRSGSVIPFNPKIVDFVEALATQAAVAIENRSLVEAQRNLMDALVKLIAGAVDAKSPYTGGHSERVPELGIMLAEVASAQTEGSLANFSFDTDDEWREFRIGALLHDCGKVTTPEYVVDKAVKLETIYNRIHEVRMRFEVLLRDAQISSLEAVASGVDPVVAKATFDARKAQLADDFAFVAECNLGDELMAEEKVERLKKIAEETWDRHFDDHLGISSDEAKRYPSESRPLPATECLLADKSHHIIPRIKTTTDDPKWRFNVTVPEHLYNYGEIYNLTISRGTLTDEERFKINEHVMQSLIMLEQLPLPKNLMRVPEYAGTHHETLNGTGYPRKLNKDEITVPMRIMAIADIFEALTASDRPYRKTKTLSEAIHTLSVFKKDGHIDGELFDLLLTSGVYQRFAEGFLLPEQIDKVDVSKYVAS